MMESIVKENLVSFKELEQKIYSYVCEIAREMTRNVLERYDQELMIERDMAKYRHKGFKKTSIKTVYGEVEYSRRIYKVMPEGSRPAFVFLLDEAMKMEKIGLVSSNLAAKIAMTITEAPYRATAEMISSACGQTISYQGVWNLIQRLGSQICEEEKAEVVRMNNGQSAGEKITPVLFEEMDGVWLRMQRPDHKKAPKQEMKVFTMYEGWDEEAEKAKRSTLVGKAVMAGMDSGPVFQEKREAFIRSRYDADEIQQRILNGDGGSWISEPYDPEAIIQLDRYHIHKEIRRLIKGKEPQGIICSLLAQEQIGEMLAYINDWAEKREDTEEGRKERKNALELYQYLDNHREGLLPYQHRGIRIPAPPKGLIYKGMGVQENQNCTLITLRMKHRRMRWGRGADALAKILYRKENRELIGTIDRYSDGLITKVDLEEITKTLSAAKAPKKDGRGDPYLEIIRGHMPLLEAMQTVSRKAFTRAFM